MYTYENKQEKQETRNVGNTGNVENDTLQLKDNENQTMGFVDNRPRAIYQRKENNTGLPDGLKAGVENLAGMDMSDVRVHRNSLKPAAVSAYAYTQGTDIHLGPGQERHLPHEAWHAVQQKQGRVTSTRQMKGGVNINDDAGLEKEANVMGQKSARFPNLTGSPPPGGDSLTHRQPPVNGPVQGVFQKVKGKINIDPKNKKLYSEEDQIGAPSIIKELGTDTVFTQDRSGLHPVSLYIDSDTDNFYRFIGQHDEMVIMQRLTDHFQVLVGKKDFEPIDGDQDAQDIRLNISTYEIGDPDRDAPMDITTFTQGDESTVYYTGEASKPGLDTNFTANVSLVPVKKGWDSYPSPSTGVEMEDLPLPEQRYSADQVWVRDIRIGDKERPPTRFYPKQQSHTSSWTLVREAVMSKKNQMLNDLIKTIDEELAALRKHNPDTSVIEMLSMVPEGHLEKLRSESQPIDFWQLIVGRLIEVYVRAYQLASHATFKRGRALYHNEAQSMEMLRNNEATVRQGQPPVDSFTDLSDAVGNLLDVQFNLSLKRMDYAVAVQDWLDFLSNSFPALMKAHGAAIVDPHLKEEVSPGVKKDLGVSDVEGLLGHYNVSRPSQFTGIADPNKPIVQGGFRFQGYELPEKFQSNFVADVRLIPLEQGKSEPFDIQFQDQPVQQIEAMVYSPAQLLIDHIKISDSDRPKTKFEVKQQAHTVPWTMVRKHIIQAAKQEKLDDFLTFIEHSFQLFKKDLAKLDVVPHLDDLLNTIQNLKTSTLPANQWHDAISLILFDYFTIYQMSESASYISEEVITHGRPLGHGEAGNMNKLFHNELSFSEGKGLHDPPEKVVEAAQNLLDVEIRETLTAELWTKAILHWIEALKTLFPNLMREGYAQIVTSFVEEDLPAPVQAAESVKTRKDLINKFHPGTFP